MKNFKPGQQVVFSTDRVWWNHNDAAVFMPGFVLPAEKEVVTLRQNAKGDWWVLGEYPLSKDGKEQVFSELVLFPLSEISADETEKIIQRIEKSIHKPVPLLT